MAPALSFHQSVSHRGEDAAESNRLSGGQLRVLRYLSLLLLFSWSNLLIFLRECLKEWTTASKVSNEFLPERFAHTPVTSSNNVSYIHWTAPTLYSRAFCYRPSLSPLPPSGPSTDSTYSWGYRTSLGPSSCASWMSSSTSLAHA